MNDIVLIDNKNNIGTITLNSPASLNSLNLTMIKIILPTLRKWKDDPAIKCVILQGSGEKAFCAGGDVVSLYYGLKEADEEEEFNPTALEFFTNEYTLDYLIHTYPKPIIGLGHGIVMGGGIGMFNGCSHRLVTEKTMMAMPEITIGLYPDVAGSYFLRRLPSHIGKFIGLTGARLNAADCLETKMADFFIANSDIEDFKEELINANIQNTNQLNEICENFHNKSIAFIPESNLNNFDSEITELMRGDNLSSIFKKAQSYSSEHKWLQKSLAGFIKGCPTSAHLVMEQLKRGKDMELKEVFQMEMIMTMQCMKTGEFQEGVRALLIDKDNEPKWCPDNISDVNAEMIAKHFESPFTEHPLMDL